MSKRKVSIRPDKDGNFPINCGGEEVLIVPNYPDSTGDAGKPHEVSRVGGGIIAFRLNSENSEIRAEDLIARLKYVGIDAYYVNIVSEY
ncbi:MAG: hypothetical protein AB7I59_28010 [Geminicoccaceae bacterium]